MRRRMLPPDEQAYGFDTNAEALVMQPALLDRYVAAAANIARRAVGDPKMPPAFERYGSIKGNSNEQTYLRQTERLTEDFPTGIARWNRGAPLFSCRWGICFQDPATAQLRECDSRLKRR